MSTKNKVSVIIPAYNAESTISAAISSAHQIDEMEIIVVDDGSVDNTRRVARQYEPYVRVFSGPRRGVSAARNLGLEAASGEWILFLDADDVLLPDTLSQRLDTARSTNADVIICDWERQTFDANGQENIDVVQFAWSAYPDDSELRALVHWAAIHAIMHRRSILAKTVGFQVDVPLVEDARFLFDVACVGATFAHSPHTGCRYVSRPDSASNSGQREMPGYIYHNVRHAERVWRSRNSMTLQRQRVLAERYFASALGFFVDADPRYWDSITRAHALGHRDSRHSRLTLPLARLVGLSAALRLTQFTKRIF